MIEFYELNISMEEVFEVDRIVAEKQDNGAYKLGNPFGPDRYMSEKKLDSYEPFGINGKWLMAFSGKVPVDTARAFNGFIDGIIEGKYRYIGKIQQEYRAREEQVEKKIAYFEKLKKKP